MRTPCFFLIDKTTCALVHTYNTNNTSTTREQPKNLNQQGEHSLRFMTQRARFEQEIFLFIFLYVFVFVSYFLYILYCWNSI